MEITPTKIICTLDRVRDYGVKLEEGTVRRAAGRQFELPCSMFGRYRQEGSRQCYAHCSREMS